MKVDITLFISKRKKLSLLALLLLCLSTPSLYSQSCDCPALNSCGPCEGGLTTLTLQYTGGALLTSIEVVDGAGNILYSGTANPFSFKSIGYPNEPFAGGEITVNVYGLLLLPTSSTTINTSCTDPVYQGSQFEDFTVVTGESLSGGTICCAEADMETNPPVISGCPADIGVASTATECSIAVNWTPPTATDDCGVSSLTSTHYPGDSFQIGTTTVTYTATDDYGNTSICSFNVIVSDEVPPELTGCPTSEIIVSADGLCEASVTWSTPTATDCSPLTITASHNSGDVFQIGTTTVTYTATDSYNNATSCSFNITVEDNTAPTITCPADQVVFSDANCQASLSDYTGAATTDNCSAIISVTQSPAVGTTLTVGSPTLVTLMATDEAGNTTSCTFNVTVEDNTAPTITCPADQVVLADANCEASLSDYTGAATNDNCSTIISVTQSPAVGTTVSVGSPTLVTLTATDEAGNTTSCTFNVTVEDNTAPTITCPADQVVLADANCEASLSDYTGAAINDNCSTIISVTQSPAVGTTLSAGSPTLVTLTAADEAGNTTSCTFNVTVEDVTDPVLTNCPSDVYITLSATSCLIAASWTPPTSADDCGSSTLTSTHQSGDSFSVGSTTVVYTATDDHGNTSSCSFNVVVSDITAPVFDTCDESKIVEVTTADGCEATAEWSPLTATDNCAVTVTSNYNPGDVFPVGKTQVTYTATDNSGNSVTCSFHVQVKDKTLPVISGCPKDIVATSASCEVSVNWTEPTVSDNCSGTLTSSHKPGDYFGIGTTVVTYWATDPSDNLDSCYFNVTVKGEDSEAPVISGCPTTDILAATDVNATSCGMAVFWTEPTADDRCGTVSLTSTYTSGDVFPVGTTEVTYTATDGSNNTSTCVFNVVVSDKTRPVISTCPTSDIFAIANESCEATVVWTEPTAYDNCGTVTMTSSHTSGAIFPMGITEVAYTATDESGNISQCMFNVIVRNEAPVVITGCPEDISVTVNTMEPVSINWEPPSATAFCGEVSLTSSHQPGDLFSIGSTVIAYTATDEAGNGMPCTFTVNVTYEEATLDIARIITPDGDGVNDKWILANVENFQDNKVMIVDRWGSVVFSGSGYNNENIVWKGRSVDGVMVPTGTYFYTISIRTASDVVEKRGFIELIR